MLIIIISALTLNCSRSGKRITRKSTEKKPEYSLVEKTRRKGDNRNTNNFGTLSSLYEKYKKSVFVIYTYDGKNSYQGTGFFISKEGTAISNYHVFKGTTKGLEVIKTHNNNEFKIIDVLKYDEKLDYIIFNVNIQNDFNCQPIPISSEKSIIGEDVFAIGNPLGLENTLSKGIISGYRENNNYIQTTTEITNGSSGGPLMNMRGEVVGITTSGFGEANLNFAVNINSIPLN